MSSDTFFSWLANLFYPSIASKVAFPIILFLDGHTSHLNVAVSEFCQERQIILYCLPPHASHILQPLDVSVFGPLKKLWNKAIDDFKEEFKMPMTKANFFSAFDKAWKNLTSKKHSVAGFKATGLVPYNPNQIDFSKLLGGTSEKERQSKNELRNVDRHNQVGILMCLKKIENILPEHMMNVFKERFAEGYDADVNPNEELLWKVYKEIRSLAESSGCSTTEAQGPDGSQTHTQSQNEDDAAGLEERDRLTVECDNSTTTVQVETLNTEDENPQISGEASIPESGAIIINPSFTTASDNQRAASNENMTNVALTSTPNQRENSLIPGPSTTIGSNVSNACRSLTFDDWEHSPFKHYLKIADKTIITRKVAKKKPKTPSALSGTECLAMLRSEQEKKAKALEEKERRKKEREEKKKKKTCEKKRQPAAVEEMDELPETEEEIIFAASSDDEISFEKNICGACEGSEGWEDGEKWIGCNSCIRWYHKDCISGDNTNMSDEELRKFNFICPVCDRLNKKKSKKTNK